MTRAREAAGYPYRPGFAKASGVGVTSLWKLESGEPVGPAVYEAVARILPGWDEDTPRRILEGDEPPAARGREPAGNSAGSSSSISDAEQALVAVLIDREWSAKEIADAIDALRRRKGGVPDVGERSGTDH